MELAISYDNIGRFHSLNGDYLLAMENFLSAKNVRDEICDNDGLADSYYNLGHTQQLQGLYAGALENILRSLHLRKAKGDKPGGHTGPSYSRRYSRSAGRLHSGYSKLFKITSA